MDAMTVRWSEYEYYDVNEDANVVQFQAITPLGTWCVDVIPESSRSYRRYKQAFQETITQLMVDGHKLYEDINLAERILETMEHSHTVH